MPMVRFPICEIRCQVGRIVKLVNTKLTVGIDMQIDQDNLRRKNDELIQAFREKSRKQLQTQELYDKLKRRAMLGQVQNAASDAVDHTIQASVTANRLIDRLSDQNQQPSQPPLYQAAGVQHSNASPVGRINTGHSRNDDGTWGRFRSQESVQRTYDGKATVLVAAN